MKYILQAIILLFPFHLVAQNTNTYSLQDLGKYDVHQVKKGETLYSLSRQYHTTVAHLLNLNSSIVDNKLKTGSTVKVPKQVVTNTTVETNTYKGIGPKPYLVPVYYQVAKGETLYSIGKKTENDVEVIKLWNDLKSNDIKPSQKLIVGYSENTNVIIGTTPIKETTATTTTTTEPISKPVATNTVIKEKPTPIPTTVSTSPTKSTDAIKEKPLVTSTSSTPTEIKTSTKSVYESNSNSKLVYLNEKGICTWTKENSDNGNLFALHPNAPIGSTISVKNMMNNRSIQVKVIGRLPNTPENENVSIKISGSAAKQLNALDSKFLVQLNYMGYEQKPMQP